MSSRPLRMHAVGRAAPWSLVGTSFAVALVAWLAAACALVPAASSLAAGRAAAELPVLALHLVGLGFFPFAVAGAAWHVLPVMLRNDIASTRRLWLSLPLLAGGIPLGIGVAVGRAAIVWVGSALLLAGLALVIAELAGLIRRVPPGKTLVTSRAGVALSAFHAVAAFVLGALVFGSGGPTVLGTGFDRMVLVHLTVAGLGWLTLLILSVGRTLAPMLALAPASEPRRWPVLELVFTAGLWVLLAGIASGLAPLALAGGIVVVAVLGRFGAQVAGVVRTRLLRPIEGPLAHFVVGVLFLAEAAGVGFATLAGALDERRGAAAFALLLVVGWAAGVTVGHAGKLLSLSAWATWPPGPRPRQEALYARAPWAAEAIVFALGIQLLTVAVLVGSTAAGRLGAALLVVAAAVGLAGAVLTVRRARAGRANPIGPERRRG